MKSLVLAVLLAASAAPALAQTPPASAPPASPQSTAPASPSGGAGASDARAAMAKACQADFAKSCPDKTGPDMQACVREHFSDLSEGCRGAIMTMMAGQNGG